jgi:hypothetical protein
LSRCMGWTRQERERRGTSGIAQSTAGIGRSEAGARRVRPA